MTLPLGNLFNLAFDPFSRAKSGADVNGTDWFLGQIKDLHIVVNSSSSSSVLSPTAENRPLSCYAICLGNMPMESRVRLAIQSISSTRILIMS